MTNASVKPAAGSVMGVVTIVPLNSPAMTTLPVAATARRLPMADVPLGSVWKAVAVPVDCSCSRKASWVPPLMVWPLYVAEVPNAPVT